MDLFDSHISSSSIRNHNSLGKNGKREFKKKIRPSDAEIRAKFAQHQQEKASEKKAVKLDLSNSVGFSRDNKTSPVAKAKKLAPKEENLIITKEGDEKTGPVGDIQNNSPDMPETKEKLKNLLKSGGFRFKQKEKEILAKILGK